MISEILGVIAIIAIKGGFHLRDSRRHILAIRRALESLDCQDIQIAEQYLLTTKGFHAYQVLFSDNTSYHYRISCKVTTYGRVQEILWEKSPQELMRQRAQAYQLAEGLKLLK